MPLKNKLGFPPGGYIFFQPETQWSAPYPLSDNFDQTVIRIIEHRLANPRFNLSTDTDAVAEELDVFTCTRLKFDPYWCSSTAQKKTLTKPFQKSPFAKVAYLVGRLKRTTKGAKILSEWFGEGGMPVSPDISVKRAKVCSTCPHNKLDEGIKDKIADTIKEHLEAKNNLQLSTPFDSSLKTCELCGCNLELKVHVPPRNLTDDVDFPDFCWNGSESHKQLLIVIPFYKGDLNQAKDLLLWIEELGGAKNNECLLLADIKVPMEETNRLRALADKSFAKTYIKTTPHSLPREGWPLGPNWMFETACRHIHDNFDNPWLWLEPDALPLKQGWVEAMENEYNSCGKPFMGAVVSSSGQMNVPGDHLTGVAIYPPNAHEYLKVNYGRPEAFDMTSAPYVLPHTHHTRAHFHFWGQKDLAPVFKADKSPDNPKNTLLLGTIPQEAYLFHRCKGPSLLQLLRLTKSNQ